MLSSSQGSHPGKPDNGDVCLSLAFIPFVPECRISLWFVWAFSKSLFADPERCQAHAPEAAGQFCVRLT